MEFLATYATKPFEFLWSYGLPFILVLSVLVFVHEWGHYIVARLCGLEVLGLGPQRIPTLGRTIYEAKNAGALIQNLWWWWGIPTLLLALMFVGLLLINLGLDEVSNPRLRKA